MTTILLRKISITYLLLPNILFAFGWFRQPYSSVLIIGLLFLLYREYRKPGQGDVQLSASDILFLLLFAAIWTFFMGAGGYSEQKNDFFTHNGKFYDLYKNSWPTYFTEVDSYACYYFGYFLVPSFLGKVFGHLSPFVIYLWTFIGFFLGLSWVYLLINRSKFGLFAFFWLRGIGYIIHLASRELHLGDIPIYRPVINGLVQQASYAPNQLLGTLIVTCIMVHDVFIKKEIRETAFPILLIFIWGIIPSFAIVIIYILVGIRYYILENRTKELWNLHSIPSLLIPAILSLPIIGYFSSANNATVRGFLWQFDEPGHATIYYVLGVGLDFLLYYYLVKSLRKKEVMIPFWFIKSIFIATLVFSTYRMGFHNDWFYRAQIPFFIIVVIYLIRGVLSYVKERSMPVRWLDHSLFALVLLMMLVQMASYLHLIRDNMVVKSVFPSATKFKPYPYDKFPNVYQLLRKMYGNRGDAEQYLGEKGSFYEVHLAKQQKSHN